MPQHGVSLTTATLFRNGNVRGGARPFTEVNRSFEVSQTNVLGGNMRKWINRTARVVLIAAAFSVVGSGIAGAGTSGVSSRRMSTWDSILGQAVGSVTNVCRHLATPAGRINGSVCSSLSRHRKGRRTVPMSHAPMNQAPTNHAAPVDPDTSQASGNTPQNVNSQPEQQESQQNLGDLLNSAGISDELAGLGIG
jgi:hypothetical protein